MFIKEGEKMNERENPFLSALSRDIVESANFIGREQILQQINDAVILPRGQKGSRAIIGLPDIGKRCLVEKAIATYQEEMQRQQMIAITVDLATYTEPGKHDRFFRDLIRFCKYELEDRELTTTLLPNLEQITRRTLSEWDEDIKSITPLQNFFKKIHQAGYQVMFVLDNFDHAESLFKEHVKRVEWLRYLAGPGCRVIWIALSCKPIGEIKRVPKAVSDDFVNALFLGMFTAEEMQVYFHFLEQTGIVLTAGQKEQVLAFCGRHPYLLALLGYHLVEEYARQPALVDVAAAFARVEERFFQSYERIIELVLTNDGNDEKLQKVGQILSGHLSEVVSKDLERLLAYDLITPNPAWSPDLDGLLPAYKAFSEHFQMYLETRLSSSAPSDPATEAEQALDLSTWSQTMHPDEMIDNRYTVVERLGANEHNQVVRARDEKLGRFVVLKRLHLAPQFATEGIRKGKDFLLREAEILAALKHAYIATVHDIIHEPPTIVMEWIEGETLDHFWQRGLSDLEVVLLGSKLAQVLKYLHTQVDAEGLTIIHRDIKPQNIMIRRNGDPVLIDFGIARATKRVGTIHSYDRQGYGIAAGTLDYAAPEQMNDPKNVTDRADIYSLGLVLYEALTLSQRPSGPLQLERSPDERVPLALWKILYPMLSRDPLARPDANQLHQSLERCFLVLKGIETF